MSVRPRLRSHLQRDQWAKRPHLRRDIWGPNDEKMKVHQIDPFILKSFGSVLTTRPSSFESFGTLTDYIFLEIEIDNSCCGVGWWWPSLWNSSLNAATMREVYQLSYPYEVSFVGKFSRFKYIPYAYWNTTAFDLQREVRRVWFYSK